MITVDPGRLEAHLRHLTETIGVRLTGLPGEAAAADYVAREFATAGANVAREAFPVMARDVQSEELEIFHDGVWHPAGCSLFSNTPGTGGEWVEAPLVFFEAPAAYQAPDLAGRLRGSWVVHLGCHIESREHYRRLVESQPAGLLMVDVRFPGTTPLADGMFPAYTKAVGAVPTLNVAYQDAWQWRACGATRARVRVSGGMRSATSDNVMAELSGDDPSAGVIYVGGHHDTQANSVGADDNGSATAGLLELARVLAPRPRKRTIRLISFGAEEQLSVGSAAYVRRHRDELAALGRVMFNLDSFGSLLGWNTMVANGPTELAGAVTPHFARHDQYLQWLPDLVPYADHFPFVAAGVPGLYLGRQNCTGGRFFHHRPDDDLSRVDCGLMADLLGATADCLDDWATAADLPFPGSIPAGQEAAVAVYWQDLFGGWDG